MGNTILELKRNEWDDLCNLARCSVQTDLSLELTDRHYNHRTTTVYVHVMAGKIHAIGYDDDGAILTDRVMVTQAVVASDHVSLYVTIQ